MRTIYAFAFLAFSTLNALALGIWTQKANFGGTGRNKAVSFSIGSKGYLGTGWSNTTSQDFWEWDQATDVWTQKANFAGAARIDAVGFSMGNRGYIGTGQSSMSGFHKDFWEYNPTSNTWTQRSDFGGAARSQAIGFCIGIKGYIGTGTTGSGFVADFWEYDRLTDTWTKKADFAGGPRGLAVGFSIGTFGGKGYIGTGCNSLLCYKDLWEYDPAADSWTAKANMPFMGRYYASGFSISAKGYIGLGIYDSLLGSAEDFYAWDQQTNTWSAETNFGGSYKCQATGFSIGGKGYIGTGSSFNMDFWEFTPDQTTGLPHDAQPLAASSVFPCPFSSQATISFSDSNFKIQGVYLRLYDGYGKQLRTYALEDGVTEFKLERGNFSTGVYFYEFATKNQLISTGKFLITDSNEF